MPTPSIPSHHTPDIPGSLLETMQLLSRRAREFYVEAFYLCLEMQKNIDSHHDLVIHVQGSRIDEASPPIQASEVLSFAS